MNRYVVAPLAALLLAVVPATPARACRNCVLTGSRSVDLLAYECPLIVVGEIETVRPLDGDRWGPRSVATVRVRRVLKGATDRVRFEVADGPLVSGAIGGSWHRFVPGRTSIFLLPEAPGEKPLPLRWASSVQPLERLELVEHALLRGEAIRRAYFERARAETPELYANAEAIAARMRTAAKSWPEPGAGAGFPGEPDLGLPGPGDEASRRLAGELSVEPVAAIRIASAFDPAAEPWLRHPRWRAATRLLAERRTEEILPLEKARVRRILDAAGVDAIAIDAFLHTEEAGGLDTSLTFPFGSHSAFLDAEPGLFTTDFLLRFFDFDRGRMGAIYFGYESRIAAKLEPERVRTILPALLASADPGLVRLGHSVLRAVPGDVFVDLVLESVLGGGDDSVALRGYARPRKEEERGARLGTLLDRAENRETWERARVWRALAGASIFDDGVVARARAALAAAEEGPTFPTAGLRSALAAYLAAAGAAAR